MKQHIALFACALLLLALSSLTALAQESPVTSDVPHQNNPFGLMVAAEWEQPDKAADFAQSMGVSAYRPLATFVDRPLLCAACQSARRENLDLVITIRANGGGPGHPTTAPADLNAFQTQVRAVAAKWEPLMLIIENEQNSEYFYASSPQQYLAELKAGCEAAHAVSIPCADGGMTSRVIVALAVKAELDAGRDKAALRLANSALGVRIASVQQLQRILERFGPQLTRAQQMLDGYSNAGADYVNFHWYESDPGALTEIIDFLKRKTGLPAITNEIGQRNDNPAETTAKLKAITAAGLEMAVWFSGDSSTARGNARALQNPDYSLRPTGVAFKNYMQSLASTPKAK